MSSVCTALGLDIYALRDVFSYRSLVHAIAGAAGSITALTVFFPLDTARTRLVVDDLREAKPTPVILHEIFKEEGIDGLYRGLFPVITSLCCSNFVYFYTYNGLKNVCVPHRDKEDALQDLLMGFVAGIVNVLLTTPLWVINSRLKIQGANLRTKQYKEQKFPKYRGIL
ncbi:peroxisomal membrane protein PMP34-like, partial [Lingula anatina]